MSGTQPDDLAAGGEAAARLYDLYLARGDRLEDFWGRRRGDEHRHEVRLFGRPVTLRADHPCFGQALARSQPRYSRAEATDLPCLVEAAVTAGTPDPGPLPQDLAPHLSYTGRGAWLHLAAGAWGAAWVDLDRRRARLVAHPRLAAEPAQLGDRLLDTVLLNLLIASGLGMLHASCLARGGAVVLVLGDHNTGKTTTSLRAVLSGAFDLVTDSMVHVDQGPDGRCRLHGFPVGRMKLRADVAAQLLAAGTVGAGELTPEQVRGETKHVLDLARFAPARVVHDAAAADTVHLCLLRRHDAARSAVQPVSGDEVGDAVLTNSLFFDGPAGWRVNTGHLARLLRQARCHRLLAGTDPDDLVRALVGLVDGGA